MTRTKLSFRLDFAEDGVGGQPLPSECARTENLVVAEGLEGGGRNGRDGNGIADGVEDLYGVTFRAVGGDVMVDKLDDVAAPETMLRQVARQRHVSIELELHRPPCHHRAEGTLSHPWLTRSAPLFGQQGNNGGRQLLPGLHHRPAVFRM